MYFWRLLILYALFENTMACPSNCICKWKGGKQTVECVNKSMITVPDGIDSSTQVLDFTGNNLKMLGSEQFERMNLVNLQKIFLSRCRLTQLDDRTFKGLTNLVELDLSNNILKSIPTATFLDYPALMKLNLNGNPFEIIKSYSFKTLKFLIHLELSRCELKVIEKDAFYGLNALEWLKLDYNSLKYIPGIHTIPRKLHNINLQHNPWYCDCKLHDLYIWLNGTTIPQAVEPICDGPVRLRGAPIKLLDENELACLPDVSPTSLYLEISEGKNVSLVCRVNSIPEAKVSWRFRDNILQNDSIIAPGVHLYYYLEEGSVEKVSELFIFNANVEDNGTFICQAENPAGKAQSNYTIRIVLKEEPLPYVKKIPIEYIIAACILAAVILIFLLICGITCLLRYRVKKRKRRKKEKTKELALYNTDSDIRASPITRNGETLAVCNDPSIQKPNGGIFTTDGSMLKMSTIAETVGNAAISHVFYPCSQLPSEQNPDLINDTGKDVRKLSSNLESLVIRMDDSYIGRGGMTLVKNTSMANCDPTIADSLAYTTAMSQCQDASRGWSTPYDGANQPTSIPVNICYNHFQARDIHLTPDKFIVDGYPTDYGLPKVPTHFPPILPATAFYRTLPHRRHNQSSNPCNVRYVREAEFLTHAVQQPASYEHFHGAASSGVSTSSAVAGDVRYNVEGYPKDSPSYTYTPHVSFSDTVQILGKSSDLSMSSSGQTDGSTTMNSSMQNEDHTSSGADKRLDNSQTELKDTKPRRVSACAKNLNDSPDEGYVGECPDTTDV
ncbi:leucine-rich repeat-containing protein 24 [Planococcus citri]|uniref:leucine-rich repeat-containing protein 24 n=1 Tax=Planococcus citri TaxID=170843 RepID=UPI0031F72F73